MKLRFEKSEACQDAHSGEPDDTRHVEYDTTDGPWFQLTYNTIRTQDGAGIAYVDPEDGCWVTEDDGQHWSDVVISV